MTQPLWTPTPERNRNSAFAEYLDWLRRERGRDFTCYRDAWRWSVEEPENFWASLWDWSDIDAAVPYQQVLDTRAMPGTRWFHGATLNYAAHALRSSDDAAPAILFQSETQALATITWADLRARVGAAAEGLRRLGVKRGDVVAAVLPNIPEAVIAFLACASIGAVWTCCSPEFGAQSIIARFGQLNPKVLIAVADHVYGGRRHDRRETIAQVRSALRSLTATVVVSEESQGANRITWQEMTSHATPPRHEPVPFEHPLWVLFSSGTTGVPKAIVHGHGGIVLEHMKALALQNSMRRGDVFFWHTTTSWMMWNLLVGGLLCGCTIVLYDGSPAHPDLDVLWSLVERAQVTRFGAGAAFFVTCMNAGLVPRAGHEFGALRAVGSTGSPLPAAAYRWIHEDVKRDVWLVSSSGGTDVATAFLGACPFEPVYEGELQGPALGAAVHAYDGEGRDIVGTTGELVVTLPMPSMPLFLWNDSGFERYRATWFDRWPGVWRHGDRVLITERGSAIIEGRSDATLNRHGVRMGTGEIYAALDGIREIEDSLVVGIEQKEGGYWMPLFVALSPGAVLDEALRERIRNRIRNHATPRHVPDEIIAVPAIPRTANGKRLEVPVKRILSGMPASIDEGAVGDAESLRVFYALASSRAEIRSR